jgi:amidase
VLRPSSYCGVFGFKPTYNAFNRRGVFPAAESLDTLGLMSRSVDDIELFSDVLELRPATQPVTLTRAPRIGLCRTPLWPAAQPETAAAVEDAAARLGKAGAQIREIVLPPEFSGLRNAARETINNYERAAAMAYEWNTRRDAISEKLRKRLEIGRATPPADYLSALKLGEDCRARLDSVFDGCDVLLAPAVHGEAPLGLAETGDPGFQAIWTFLYTPVMTLPTHRGPNRMPVGIQLVALPHEDRRLFAAARWVWQQMGAPEIGTK